MATHPIFGRAMTPAEYAAEWTKSANDFAAMGAYQWMAQQLGTATNVAEIGGGSGASTLQLLKDGRAVTSIDVNQQLVDSAQAYLQNTGMRTQLLTMADLPVGPATAVPAARALVANALSKDPDNAMQPSSLDAIICWMIGASPDVIERTLARPVEAFTGQEPADYREVVHRRCFVLGESWLKTGGTVHLVDRVVIRSWQDKDSMRDQAAAMYQTLAGKGYSIHRGNVFLRKLEGLGGSAIQYAAPVEVASSRGVIALCSVKAIKL